MSFEAVTVFCLLPFLIIAAAFRLVLVVPRVPLLAIFVLVNIRVLFIIRVALSCFLFCSVELTMNSSVYNKSLCWAAVVVSY